MAKTISRYNCYFIDDEIYVNVSTILGVESSGDLIRWALKKFEDETAYGQFMNDVSAKGTYLHAFMEADLKGEKFKLDWREDCEAAIEDYFEWKKGKKIKLIASEKMVYSKKYRVAGTLDLIMEMDGEVYIADFKTGRVYPKAFTQICAYKSFLKENPLGLKKATIQKAKPLVIQVPRDGGEVKEVRLGDLDPLKESDHVGIFHALRYIWVKRNVKSKKWRPMIKNIKDVISPLHKSFEEKLVGVK